MTEDALELGSLNVGSESRVTSIDLANEGHILVGYSCGTVALFHKGFTSALTSWYYVCDSAIQ